MNLKLSELLMHNTVRIEATENSKKIRHGTSFFFTYQLSNNKTVTVLVTTKHLVRDADSAVLAFTCADSAGGPIYGNPFLYRIERFEKQFIMHPEENIDLCIMPILPFFNDINSRYKTNIFRTSFFESDIPRSDVIESLSALESVVMVGYPYGVWDKINNLPIIRSGSTAVHPKFDFNGKPSLVVDIANFPGSSGSPVVIFNEGEYFSNGTMSEGNRVLFLGVTYAGESVLENGRPSRVWINLSYAVKSHKLLDFKPILEKMYAR